MMLLTTESMQMLRPPPETTITEHAQEHRILSPENCAIPGPYRVAVTPFIKEILDTITRPDVEKIVCQKSAQVAWTDGVINNCVSYFVHHDPAPIMVLFPTTSMAERYSKEKLAPMIRDTQVLNKLIADPKSRDSGNTILSKNFPGGHMELVGSNAPANLASSPIRVVIVEEPDRCSANSGKEGDSLKLSFERSKTFWNRRLILGGSPTIKGISQIEREMALSDQRRFEIPCPYCDEFQTLEWSMVVWASDPDRNHDVFGPHRPETAALRCKHCSQLFNNAQKNAQLSRGRWQPTAEFTGTAGFYINELYSPFPKATLQNVVEKFLEAKKELKAGNPHLMTTWTNTSLGETWEEKGETIDDADIATEALVDGEAPEGVLLITVGVDVQKDRIELETVGFGVDEETWSLSYDILYGDPERDDVWKQLDEHLDRTWLRNEAHEMKVACTCVDSGNWTQAVYRYVRPRQKNKIFAVKGKEGHGEALVAAPTKKSLDKGVLLHSVSDQTAVGHIYGKLRVTEPGPGYCHFPDDRDDEFFKQLTGCHLVTRFKNGVPFKKYLPTRKRIEALDCRKYAIAAMMIITKGKPNWTRLERTAAIALAKAEGKDKKKKKKAPKKRHGGFVNRWMT